MENCIIKFLICYFYPFQTDCGTDVGDLWHVGKLCDTSKNCGQEKEIFPIERVWNHPDYDVDFNNANDFTLVKLKGRSSIDPVEVEPDSTSFYEGGT